MLMRNWYLRAKSWTYFMIYGPSLHTLPFSSNRTSGSDFVRSCWTRLVTWWNRDEMNVEILLRWATRLLSRSQRYEALARRYRHVGSHRGQGRATRASSRRTREQSSLSLANKRAFAELRTDPTLIGEMWMEDPVKPPRAYRRLAWSKLNHDATVEIAKVRPEAWDPYESMP